MLIPRGRANKGFEGAGERAVFGYAGSHCNEVQLGLKLGGRSRVSLHR